MHLSTTIRIKGVFVNEDGLFVLHLDDRIESFIGLLSKIFKQKAIVLTILDENGKTLASNITQCSSEPTYYRLETKNYVKLVDVFNEIVFLDDTQPERNVIISSSSRDCEGLIERIVTETRVGTIHIWRRLVNNEYTKTNSIFVDRVNELLKVTSKYGSVEPFPFEVSNWHNCGFSKFTMWDPRFRQEKIKSAPKMTHVRIDRLLGAFVTLTTPDGKMSTEHHRGELVKNKLSFSIGNQTCASTDWYEVGMNIKTFFDRNRDVSYETNFPDHIVPILKSLHNIKVVLPGDERRLKFQVDYVKTKFSKRYSIYKRFPDDTEGFFMDLRLIDLADFAFEDVTLEDCKRFKSKYDKYKAEFDSYTKEDFEKKRKMMMGKCNPSPLLDIFMKRKTILIDDVYVDKIRGPIIVCRDISFHDLNNRHRRQIPFLDWLTCVSGKNLIRFNEEAFEIDVKTMDKSEILKLIFGKQNEVLSENRVAQIQHNANDSILSEYRFPKLEIDIDRNRPRDPFIWTTEPFEDIKHHDPIFTIEEELIRDASNDIPCTSSILKIYK